MLKRFGRMWRVAVAVVTTVERVEEVVGRGEVTPARLFYALRPGLETIEREFGFELPREAVWEMLGIWAQKA